MRAHQPAGVFLVEGVSAEGWIVGGRLVRGALLIAPGGAWGLPVVPLAEAGPLLGPLAGLEPPRPELLLLGTGAALGRPPEAFVTAAAAAGLRVEPMDSRAAARTYNVLAAEGRAVAALLRQ
jgi:uncharacterized protein